MYLRGVGMFCAVLLGGVFFIYSSALSAPAECTGSTGVCIIDSVGATACPGGSTASDNICAPSEHCCAYPPGTELCSDLPTNCKASCPSGSIPVTTCECSIGTNVYCASLSPTSQPAPGSCSSPNVCRNSCLSGESSLGVCTSGGTCCAPAGNPQPGGTGGNPQPGAPVTIEFKNPLKFNTVEQVLNSVLGTLQGIIVVLSLVFIVIGAILYITSAGDEGRMKTAKSAITASMIGLALGLAAPSFLKEIGKVLGWGPVESGPVASAKTLTEIATSVLDFLLSIVGILAVIMLVVGGIMYLTSAGDETKADTGKKIVTYSIIGIAVALAALVLVSQIAKFFV